MTWKSSGKQSPLGPSPGSQRLKSIQRLGSYKIIDLEDMAEKDPEIMLCLALMGYPCNGYRSELSIGPVFRTHR